MKKTHLLLLMAGCLFLLYGCGNGGTPVETDINGKPMAKSPDLFSAEFQKTDVYDKPVVFSGPATRTDYYCSGGSCDTCENPGTLNITLLPDGSAKLSHVAQCMGFGINGCSADSGNCEFTVSGRYSKAGSNIAFGKCNDRYTGDGNSAIGTDSTTGSVRCEDNGEPMMIMEWKDLPKTQ